MFILSFNSLSFHIFSILNEFSEKTTCDFVFGVHNIIM
ncbi:hypothetical protein PAE4_20913 [Bacillus altitudinis]|nr:hypothetical protein US8_01397 [Bacillus altitudinis]SPR93492.1 hypothetical protein PAE4_20913 [Bacillus altitudinis]